MDEVISEYIDQLMNGSPTNPTDEETEVNKLSSFSTIRNKFEATSKQARAVSKLPAVPPSLSPQSSDFQKLYPNFKAQFSKRQFAAMESCFNTADRNQNGFLEPKEIKQLMENHQQAINLCDAEALVNMADHDHDGKLSPKEFLEMCKPAAEILREQQHMEASSPVTEHEFIAVIIQKLRGFINPVNVKVKGTLKYFEKIVNTNSQPQHSKLKSHLSPVDTVSSRVNSDKVVLKTFQQHPGQRNENDSISNKALTADIIKTLFEDERIVSTEFEPNFITFPNYEYAWVGYTSKTAILKFGSENVNEYDSVTPGPECTIPKKTRKMTSAKVICLKTENDRIIGLHFIGPSPNARELIQGLALALQLGATKNDLRQLKCIPETCGKIFSDCCSI
ncbi:unnamed protein product [Orchesella dallaii]|uniref:EF-hand domain-containing protein n=1 Tax=Orchesella dallaii TaxID=48710 RepID=A0ABP1RCT8_9HEXA